MLLPRPDAPMMAVVSPALISKLKLLKVLSASLGIREYLNVTFSNLILSYRLTDGRFGTEFAIAGFLSNTSKMHFAETLVAIMDYTLGKAPTKVTKPVMKAINMESMSSELYGLLLLELLIYFCTNIPPRKKE